MTTKAVIGIGASAGGINALEDFFRNLPESTGLAFLVIIHQAPDRPSHLPELLQRWSGLKVVTVTEQATLEADQIFVPEAGDYLVLEGDRLTRVARASGLGLPIDYTFRSLAEVQKERAIGVVLSGGGGDGSLGIRAIKAHAGIVLAQDLESAEHTSMPSTAIDTHLVDLVLDPAGMPKHLLEIIEHWDGAETNGETVPETALQKIVRQLKSQSGGDFPDIKRTPSGAVSNAV